MASNQATNSLPAAKVIYILLIISTIVGITGIIAVIMAYVNKDGTDDWLQTHYRFQIRTYWIGLLYVAIGVLTLQLTIGFIILVFTFFWLVIRCAKGLKQLENSQEVHNIESWLFA